MRVAFFGGTFDPIHRGHLAVAAAAAAHLALDTVLFAPTGLQPLKPGRPTAAFADRLAMVALACATAMPGSGGTRYLASDVDAPRADGRPNYTVETLALLAAELPTDRLFSIVGLDSFLSLPRWREPRRLLELAEWIVVSRPGYRLAVGAMELYGAEERGRIHWLRSVEEDVSATELRLRLAAGDPCPDLIPAVVGEYVAERGLYAGAGGVVA
jgi:nicotinate-nucleotide adenylyltransferase